MSQSAKYIERMQEVIRGIRQRHERELQPWIDRLTAALEQRSVPITLQFKTRDEADAFCRKHGIGPTPSPLPAMLPLDEIGGITLDATKIETTGAFKINGPPDTTL